VTKFNHELIGRSLLSDLYPLNIREFTIYDAIYDVESIYAWNKPQEFNYTALIV
jgi:hypothetical protein